jgi:cytochrome c peroxidase
MNAGIVPIPMEVTMKTKTRCSLMNLLPVLVVLGLLGCAREAQKPLEPTAAGITHLLKNKTLQSLGEKIFFDSDLSTPAGQSCAACHSPEVGWTGPDEALNKAGAVYRGAIHSRFGNRKPNSSAYATLTPSFHARSEGDKVVFVGGDFWDGRATGWKLGNPAADQAQGPFLNPVEQNNADASVVLAKICASSYAPEFKQVAKDIWDIEDVCAASTDFAYGVVALAIAAFEHSEEVNMFSSKYDLYLKGKSALTTQEKRGLELFEGKARCANCHDSRPGPDGEPPLFTDFTYDNLGFPRNPDNPWYQMPREFNPLMERWIDPGLSGFLSGLPQYAMYAEENRGKHRVPTMRNVDLRPTPSFVKAYGHNGYFKSLEGIVHFYNTRDILPPPDEVKNPRVGIDCWPPAEVTENVNREELGNLALTSEEEAALVAFLKTLSDGYKGD